MILISHRGNLKGKNSEQENKPDYIDSAISSGFDVEIDVWFTSGQIFLGHDYPDVEVEISWLQERKDKLWLHAKNPAALEFLMMSDFHYFVHDQDLATITSKGYVWVYPGKQPIQNSIAVLPEIHDEAVHQCAGICSDIIFNYKK